MAHLAQRAQPFGHPLDYSRPRQRQLRISCKRLSGACNCFLHWNELHVTRLNFGDASFDLNCPSIIDFLLHGEAGKKVIGKNSARFWRAHESCGFKGGERIRHREIPLSTCG